MDIIKFRRVHFFDEEKTRFSHFTYWGVKLGHAEFVNPASNNFAQYYTDNQFTGLVDDRTEEIYEGDLLSEFGNDLISEVFF